MLVTLSRSLSRPWITISAVVLAVWLGMMRFPFLQYLQPIGDFYVALLQICVLPFLLATIPLAVRSALTSGTAPKVVGHLSLWLIATIVTVALVAVLVPATMFKLMPLDQATSNRIGALFGASANRVDIEFAMSHELTSAVDAAKEAGLLAIVPTNVFSALAANDSLRVIIFALIFGAGMVTSERSSGLSIFGALRHIQAVCILIFDWFNLFVPIGIIALIAPRVALLGPDIYSVLASFAYAFLAVSALLLLIPCFAMSMSMRLHPRTIFAKLLNPMALGAATRNTLVCIPAALETMTEELKAERESCELYIPIGFTIFRFGIMAYFATATLFIGYLMGRTFSGSELVFVAALSTTASFATLGVTGLPALAQMAIVLRPFGLSYELALPLMAIMDPIANMIRVMLNVALNCQIPVLASWRKEAAAAAVPVPGE
jgi:proton glutamate symport protein